MPQAESPITPAKAHGCKAVSSLHLALQCIQNAGANYPFHGRAWVRVWVPYLRVLCAWSPPVQGPADGHAQVLMQTQCVILGSPENPVLGLWQSPDWLSIWHLDVVLPNCVPQRCKTKCIFPRFLFGEGYGYPSTSDRTRESAHLGYCTHVLAVQQVGMFCK